MKTQINLFIMFKKSLIIALAFFLVHFVSCYFILPNFSIQMFITSYLSQVILTIVVLLTLLQVEKKSKEQLGYFFLGLSSAKVIISYMVAKQILFHGVNIEREIKINFFIAFLFYLCLDAFWVVKMLNKKDL